MKNSFLETKKCDELLSEYRAAGKKQKGKLLSFDIKNYFGSDVTVYNPTKPISDKSGRFLLARVEPRASEKSKVVFFKEQDKKWKISNHPIFDLQDPFYVQNIQGWQIFGGVKTYEKENGRVDFQTVFYKYKKCSTELVRKDGILSVPFAKSPIGMKDIRLIELLSGKIAVFTRPMGGEAGLGKIAYIEIDSLSDLQKAIPKAKIIDNLFCENEWGGANDLYLLRNGKIGVLGHIAQFKGKIKNYYAVSFVFDPKTKNVSGVNILTTVNDFPRVKSKRKDLAKIIFSGGMERNADGTASLYVGIGDMNAGQIKITDPFLNFEKMGT